MLTVHGNGFIQVPLAGGGRMHVWHPECPRQKVSTDIHDHRFSFTSTVIRGVLINTLFRTDPHASGRPWKVYAPGDGSTGQDHDSLFDTGCRLSCTWYSGKVISAGDTYKMEHRAFHQSVPKSERAVTVMFKTQVLPELGPSRVLVPEGQEPDNDFSREHDRDFLWRLVREALS